MSAWILATPFTWDGKTDSEAISAIRQIGTNAVPPLLVMLHSKNSWLRDWLIQRNYRVPGMKLFFISDFERCHRAMQALRVLGHSALPAIPELTNLFFGPDYTGGLTHPREEAAQVLAQIRPEGTEILVKATANKDEWVQRCAIEALRENPPAEPAVISALGRCLKAENPDIRRFAAEALGHLHASPLTAVPALRESLADPSPLVR